VRTTDSSVVSHLIQIHAANGDLPWENLIPALENLLPVRFRISPDPNTERNGDIAFENDPTGRGRDHTAAVPELRIPHHEPAAQNSRMTEVKIIFANHPMVPHPFRGRSLRAKVAVPPRILPVNGNETILARSDQGPLWTVFAQRKARQFRSAFTIPAIPSGGGFQDVLHATRFVEMLPLLHYLRELDSANAYQDPPLRACFMFDDPNLHWPRYGFVDFQQLAAHAEANHYHVAFATIPLDTWYTHATAAAIFRNHPDRLSLVVHGNDHTRKELAREYTSPRRTSLLGQAIRRIERVERKRGLSVCRVMVPPHGACSEEMLAALPDFGFEAACISHGSLRAHNRNKLWASYLGYLPCECIQGCPVLPRWGMVGIDTNTILLAAFLGQPIILRGHHQDLKHGLELLSQHAEFINALGSVSWSDMSHLCRMNYQWRMEGNVCRVKPLSRKITFPVPASSTRLVIEDSGLGGQTDWQLSNFNGILVQARTGEDIFLTDKLHGQLSIVATPTTSFPRRNGIAGSASLALLRRLLTEGRDRFFVTHN